MKVKETMESKNRVFSEKRNKDRKRTICLRRKCLSRCIGTVSTIAPTFLESRSDRPFPFDVKRKTKYPACGQKQDSSIRHVFPAGIARAVCASKCPHEDCGAVIFPHVGNICFDSVRCLFACRIRHQKWCPIIFHKSHGLDSNCPCRFGRMSLAKRDMEQWCWGIKIQKKGTK